MNSNGKSNKNKIQKTKKEVQETKKLEVDLHLKEDHEDSSDEEDNLETTDFIDAFMDTKTNILTDNFLASKKKVASLQNGRSGTFDKIRLKGKAVEMMSMIMSNNKQILKEENLYFAQEMKDLLNDSKNDKALFESTSKRVKQNLALILKNQLLINKDDKLENLKEIIFEILK